MKKKKMILILSTILVFSSCLTVMSLAQEEENYFFELKMHTTRESTWTELYKEQFAKIGIKLTIEIVDGPALWSRCDEGGATGKTFDEGGYDITTFGAAIDSLDPYGLGSVFSTGARSPSGINMMNWFNGEFDKALETGNELIDWTDREPYYWKCAEILADELPIIPLYFPQPITIMNKDLIFVDPFVQGAGTGYPTETDRWGNISLGFMDWSFWGIRFMALEEKSYEDETSFVFATRGDLERFNPVLTGWSSFNSEIHNVMYDALVWKRISFINSGEWRGNLAESWNISDDGLTFTFYLRKNIKWHDGVNFTSADVLCTFNAYLDPDTGAFGTDQISSLVESVEAPDDYTVVFHLKKYQPVVWELVFEHLIVPAHIWGDIPHNEWFTSDYNTGVKPAIGTGPYKYGEWVRGDHVSLDRYEDYHLCPIFFDHYIYKIYPDPETTRLAIQTGELDIASASGWEDRDFALQYPETMKYVYGRPFYVRQLAINCEHPLLNNKWVRKAISYAMPREHMVEDLEHNLGVPANQFLLPDTPGYNPNILDIEYSIEKAKECMEKAGYDYDYLVAPPETPTWMFIAPGVGGLVVGAIIAVITLPYIKKER